MRGPEEFASQASGENREGVLSHLLAIALSADDGSEDLSVVINAISLMTRIDELGEDIQTRLSNIMSTRSRTQAEDTSNTFDAIVFLVPLIQQVNAALERQN